MPINLKHIHRPVKLVLFLFLLCSFQEVKKGPVIHLVGDSTMATRTEPLNINPERGWGQALQQYFNKEVKVLNHAVNGRSSRSFLVEGRWAKVEEQLNPGDLVLIQFGHNDQKIKDPKRYTNPTTAYLNNLLKMVEDTRAKKAIPVLLTSIVRRKFNESGTLIDTHGLYPLIVRSLAKEENVLFIDHLYETEQLVFELGQEKSKELYVWTAPGQYAKFPQGKRDDTHLSERGADLFAHIVVEELASLDEGLARFIPGK